MAERLQAWLELATERLADKPVPLYLIPGNDDDFSIDEVLNRPQYAPVNVDGKVVEIPGGLQLLACGWSNHTPWNTPREETEDQLYERLDALARQVIGPPAGDLHDPRAAARLGARHGADPRREPAADGLGRRRAARSGRVDRRAPDHRGIPAGADDPRPHPRVRRRAQDRQDGLHQPGQRGQPRDPARVHRRHRQEGRRGRAARRGLVPRGLKPGRRTASPRPPAPARSRPARRPARTRRSCGRSSRRRGRSRAGRSRSTGSRPSVVNVAPSYQESRPPSRRPRPVSPTTSSIVSTIGS